MKKLIVMGIVLTMVMGLAAAASAGYIIKVEAQNALDTTQKSSIQFATNATANTPYVAPLSPTPQVVAFSNNNSALEQVAGNYVVAYKTLGAEPLAWYGKVFGAAGYNGVLDVRLTSATSASVLAPGTWYLYKGLGTVTGDRMSLDVLKVDTGVLKTTESTWAASTFGALFTSGDTFTISKFDQVVPEPGSMVAMLSGLVGLVGFGIRRRK
ncbi:MAG: PEP-CTERM sorting domain-containing protein [Armatimonadota bacterium]